MNRCSLDVVVLANWPAIRLDGTIHVEGQLTVNSVILVRLCLDEGGGVTVITIVVVYQPPIVITPPPPPPNDNGRPGNHNDNGGKNKNHNDNHNSNDND